MFEIKTNGKIERERERVNNAPRIFKFNFIKSAAFLFCVGFLFFAHSASAATWYISTVGTDDGSHGTAIGTGAWATLSYALTGQRVTEGDIINIQVGTYSTFYSTNVSITPSIVKTAGTGTVTVQAYSTDSVTLDMPTNTSGAFFNFSNSLWSNITFKHINFTNSSSKNVTMFFLYGDSLTLQDCTVDFNYAVQYIFQTSKGATGDAAGASTLTITRTTVKNTNYAVVLNNRTDILVNIYVESSLFYSFASSIFNILNAANLQVVNSTFSANSNSFIGIVYMKTPGGAIKLKNNIFYLAGGGTFYPIYFIYSSTSPNLYYVNNPAQWDVTNNIWYNTYYDAAVGGGSFLGDDGSTSSHLLTLDHTNHWINPSFTNSSSGDFSIQSNSLICGKGSATNLPVSDINGTAWTSNDIGAYKCPIASSSVTLQNKVAFVGDSIMLATGHETYFNTQTGVSYVALANTAIAGSGVQSMYYLVDKVIENYLPNTIFLSIGVNNLVGPTPADTTNQEYADYITQLMKKIQDWGATPIWLGIGTLNNYGSLSDTNVIAVNALVNTSCTTNGWQCYPYYNQMLLNTNWQSASPNGYYNLAGNVHPNSAGHTIIGKVAEYLYYTKGTIGIEKVDIGAGARIYKDGKFRNLNTTSGSEADLLITPQSGSFISGDYSPWLDISNMTWANVGNHHKSWIESSTITGLTNTIHTIGDLENYKYYNITVDSHVTNLTGTGCVILNDKLSCKSNSSGKISFTYGGTYSTHTFDVTEGDNTAPTTTASPTGNTFNTDQAVTLFCSDGSGSGCDKTYYTLTGVDPTTSSTQYSSTISIPSNATTILKYFSTDLTGNSEAIKSQTYIVDTIVPDAIIDSHPDSLINSNSATFTFSASETAIFQCKLDSGTYASCATPKNYTSLAEGAHTFYIKATDTATNEDATPASYSFTVDTLIPTISDLSPNNITLSVTTTSANLTLMTSETTICKYSTTSGTDFSLMTAFDSTNNITHSTLIAGLSTGTTYSYYIKCKDAINESTESSLTFSVAPLENNNISLENIKIKVGREINKFKDTIRIAKNKLKIKQTDTNLANGTVKIYKDNKRIDTIDINSDGSWDKILKLKDEFSGWIKIRQYDQFGTLFSTDKAKINVDTEDPKFNEAIPEKMTIGRNQKISFTATDDNSGIDYYKVKLADVRDWRQQNEDFYQIPEDVPNGAYDLFIRAYDKTGNYAEEKTTLSVGQSKNSAKLTQVPLKLDSPIQKTESQIQSHTDKNTDTAPNNVSSNNSPSPQPQSQPLTSHWWNPFSWF